MLTYQSLRDHGQSRLNLHNHFEGQVAQNVGMIMLYYKRQSYLRSHWCLVAPAVQNVGRK